ncbi:MAG: hypothetical protein ACOVQE_02865 [Chitinophagaceae bacterium]
MKKFLLLIGFVFFASLAFAQQSQLEVFSENKEKFYVILDGTQQNEKSQDRVLIKDLKAEYGYKLKIIMDDNSTAKMEINQQVYLVPNERSTFLITKNKNGKMVLKQRGTTRL